MVSTLSEWSEKYGENESFTRPVKSGFTYEQDVAYSVRVKAAKVIKTKRNEIQLQLDLDVLDGEESAGTSREWLTLPKQVTDSNLKDELVRKLTLRRRDDLQRILSASPGYKSAQIWDAREVVDGKVRHSFEGTPLDFKSFREREKAVNAFVMQVTDEWHEDPGSDLSEGLTGAEFFLVKAANKSKPQYPYTNIYNVRPDKVQVFGEVEAA